MMGEKISVIIPTYYRNELLRDAIESVTQQDYNPVELIVVDDSGEGHAEPVFKEYDEVDGIIRDENGDWDGAYNTGVRASTGDYIQFLDDDDLLLEGKLLKTATVLQENPDVGVAFCGVKTDEKYHYPNPEQSENMLECMLRFEHFPCCTVSMLMKRDAMMNILPLTGPSDNNGAGDHNLIVDLAQRTNFDYVDECLVHYRTNESRRWVGLNKLQKKKQFIRHRSDLYDQFPSFRRSVLVDIYEREGRHRLQGRPWSAKAVLCFMKATYYTDQHRLRCGGQLVASLFGRFGLDALRSLRDTIRN